MSRGRNEMESKQKDADGQRKHKKAEETAPLSSTFTLPSQHVSVRDCEPAKQ